MNHHYRDIKERIPELPYWWDENAVPRYCDFKPKETADIYSKEAALVQIKCQSCGRLFKVCFSYSQVALVHNPDARTVKERIEKDELFYGDPPNDACCSAGATMTSDSVRVLEYWYQNGEHKWKRDKKLEIPLERKDEGLHET